MENFEPTSGYDETMSLLKGLIPGPSAAAEDVPPILMELDYLELCDIVPSEELSLPELPTKELALVPKGEKKFCFCDAIIFYDVI